MFGSGTASGGTTASQPVFKPLFGGFGNPPNGGLSQPPFGMPQTTPLAPSGQQPGLSTNSGTSQKPIECSPSEGIQNGKQANADTQDGSHAATATAKEIPTSQIGSTIPKTSLTGAADDKDASDTTRPIKSKGSVFSPFSFGAPPPKPVDLGAKSDVSKEGGRFSIFSGEPKGIQEGTSRPSTGSSKPSSPPVANLFALGCVIKDPVDAAEGKAMTAKPPVFDATSLGPSSIVTVDSAHLTWGFARARKVKTRADLLAARDVLRKAEEEYEKAKREELAQFQLLVAQREKEDWD